MGPGEPHEHHHHRSGSDLDRPIFCAGCGGALAVEKDPRTNGWACRACGRTSWNDPKVAACSIPWWEGRLVLARRAIEPRHGFWVTPGGYCERGERPAAAAERETREEIGLEVRATDVAGVYAFDGNPVVVIMYECEVLGGGPPRALSEVLEVGLFAPEDVPWDGIAFQSTSAALRDHLARRARRAEGRGP